MGKPALKLLLIVVVLIAASCAADTPAGDRPAGDTTEFNRRDFNGIWQYFTADLTQFVMPGERIDLTAHGADAYKKVDQAGFLGNSCLPYGPTRAMAATNPIMFVHDPNNANANVAVIAEHIDYRVFYMNAAHPDDIMEYPEWMGHSTAKWEGDTLVVDTIGMRPETWLDRGGLMHSEKLHLVERFDRTGVNEITWTVTVEDPVFFEHPWKYQLKLARLDFPRLIPARCADNEVDADHMRPTPGTIHKNPPYFQGVQLPSDGPEG
jgi:hypothetical protein